MITGHYRVAAAGSAKRTGWAGQARPDPCLGRDMFDGQRGAALPGDPPMAGVTELTSSSVWAARLSEARASIRVMFEDDPQVLYRIFEGRKAKALLYIGVTNSLPRRMGEHQADKERRSSHRGGCRASRLRAGLPVLRRRKSTFVYGIEDDAREVIDHIVRYLADRV
jgi:hypothetical protein